MRAQLRAATAIFHRDLQVFLSYRTAAVSLFFSGLFSIALFYYISRLVGVRGFETKQDYFAFVVVGLVILAVLQSTLVLSAALRGELIAGTFERVILSPFGPVRAVLSMMIFPIVQALFLGAWTLAVAAIFFGLDLQWATLPLALPAAILAALSFSALALAVTAAVILFKQAPGLGVLLAGITLVSGLYFPAQLLPAWIRWTAEVQPFTPAVDLLRSLLVGLPVSHPAWVYAARLAGFAVVLLPLATWALARAIEIGQRRGTIIEY